MRCTAIKNKTSITQCAAQSVFGKTLCGRHIRSKNVTLWEVVNAARFQKLGRFQAIFRGRRVRNFLKLAGPGVLCRNNLANDEDVATCNEKDQVHPFNYFAFEENGKVWWFEFNSIWTWCSKSTHPTNPYTKTELTTDTRKRLHAAWGARVSKRMELPKEPAAYNECITGRWNIICQIFADHGFVDIHPGHFSNLRSKDYYHMFSLLHYDLLSHPTENAPRLSWLRHRMRWMKRNVVKNYQGVLYATHNLLTMVAVPRDDKIYNLIFHTLSALYRC
jgi:hypothetical protein